MTNPLDLERKFLYWKKLVKDKFFVGNVLKLKEGFRKGTKGVVLQVDGFLVSKNGSTTKPYKKKFVFFEDGVRESVNFELDENTDSVGKIGNAISTIQEIEKNVVDPCVPDKKIKYFFINV